MGFLFALLFFATTIMFAVAAYLLWDRSKKTSATLAATETELAKYSGIRDIVAAQTQLDAQYRTNEAAYRAMMERGAQIQAHLESLEEHENFVEVGYYEPHFDFEDSEAFKVAIKRVREQQKAMLKAKRAAICDTEWTVDGSTAKGRKVTNRQLKLMLRAFNGEADAMTSKVTYANIDVMERRLHASFNAINKLGETRGSSITPEYANLKLDELRLTHELRMKQQEEKEEQRRIREEMREEQKAEKERRRAIREAEEEEARYQQALEEARREMETSDQAHRDELAARIAELEQHIADTARKKSMAELTRRGHVYVISNIGSFGEGVFKIGMTRRLEPLDRVRELGDASVPFLFDVHAMIHTTDAPALEKALHDRFELRRVNKVNYRKEFFRVSLAEIERAVGELHQFDGEFKRTAVAEEFRRTVAMDRRPSQPPPVPVHA